MKKIIIFLLTLLIVPMNIWAFEEMADDMLENISGQSGIDIFLEGTTKVQVELGDFSITDNDANGGTIKIDNQAFGEYGDKIIFYLAMHNTLFKLDVGSSGSGIFDSDSSNQIVDGTQLVLENRSFVKVGLPAVTDFEISLEMPGKNDIIFQNKDGNNACSLGGLVMTPITVQINEIYNDLYISSH
jgi:hypothetical protein